MPNANCEPFCGDFLLPNTGKDFIVEASSGSLAGDPFSLWIGDGTWMNVHLKLGVTDAGGGYLAYTEM